MAISNHTIISKMLQELQPLQEKTPSKMELVKHIGNVKLMCELLLENAEEDSAAKQTTIQSQQPITNEKMIQMLEQTPKMTEQEYNVMIKGKESVEKAEHIAENKVPTKNMRTDHNGANGESIFDF